MLDGLLGLEWRKQLAEVQVPRVFRSVTGNGKLKKTGGKQCWLIGEEAVLLVHQHKCVPPSVSPSQGSIVHLESQAISIFHPRQARHL